MTWWGNSLNGKSRNPKFKNKFFIEFGTGGTLWHVKSVSKPSVTIEKKEYTMINHSYNYPGIPKWDPITIKFVDAYGWGNSNVGPGNLEVSNADISVGERLWEMLLATGYVNPANKASALDTLVKVVSPEKAATVSLAFGNVLKIHQMNNHFMYDDRGTTQRTGDSGVARFPEGDDRRYFVNETQDVWTLYNPIITKIQWGDLDYGDDTMVECTLEIAYDWAEFSKPGTELTELPTEL